ncbi:MAG: tRNA lysidine(34) synthetase TilS [Oscillospiraceae bacterium]|nr:tRNA lysidine(34) synthetase TilS [Oscillospiraceae bacterium]
MLANFDGQQTTRNVQSTITKYNMIRRGDKVIIGLSGGADSVCLLYVMLELKEELGITLEACHINHLLRGEQSDDDEKFVIELCKKLQIPLKVHRADVKSLQKKHQSLEECARETRYSFFFDIGTNVLIATAHNADDNTETVLLNLIRGTALKGLCGIPPIRENIIRPLIETQRAEISAYIKEKNIDFVVDESNFSDKFTRNYLRNNVMPLLQKINPSLKAGITRMGETLRRDDEYLHDIAVSALKDAAVPDTNAYRADALLNLHPAILNRIISLILSQNNISPSNLRINGIVSMLTPSEKSAPSGKSAPSEKPAANGKINLAKNKFAIVKDNLLYIETIRQNYRRN